MGKGKRLLLGGCILGLLAAAGCVRREMTITSEPSGADVIVNQTWKGKTPYKLRFKHYGTYAIRLEKEGYHPLYVEEPVAAPPYEQPGVDLVSEALVPARIEDKRQLHYELQPVGEADPLEKVLARGRAMRDEVQRVAAVREAESAERTPRDWPLPERHESDDAPAPARSESSSTPPEIETDRP